MWNPLKEQAALLADEDAAVQQLRQDQWYMNQSPPVRAELRHKVRMVYRGMVARNNLIAEVQRILDSRRKWDKDLQAADAAVALAPMPTND